MKNRYGRHGRPVRAGCGMGGAAALGAVMIAAGLLLLFLCIPGWAWAALCGALLVLLGCLLIRLGGR